MAVDTSSVRWIVNGEPLDQEVLNRPIRDLANAIPDASVTKKGLIEIATTQEALAGVDNIRAVTPLGLFSAIQNAISGIVIPGGVLSPQTNGYYIDSSSGLVIQWGFVERPANTMTALIYPIAFPNACLNATACIGASISVNGYHTVGIQQDPSQPRTRALITVATNVANESLGVFWIAVGH